jgi:hypothetical protein
MEQNGNYTTDPALVVGDDDHTVEKQGLLHNTDARRSASSSAAQPLQRISSENFEQPSNRLGSSRVHIRHPILWTSLAERTLWRFLRLLVTCMSPATTWTKHSLIWFSLCSIVASISAFTDIYFLMMVGIGSGDKLRGFSEKEHSLIIPFGNGASSQAKFETIHIIPDTGYNLIALPAHLLNIGMMAFLGSKETRVYYAELLRLMVFSKTHIVSQCVIVVIIAASLTTYFLKYSHYRICEFSWCSKFGNWWTPDLADRFSDGEANPAPQIVAAALCEFVGVLAVAACATIISVATVHTNKTKQNFLALLAQQANLNSSEFVAVSVFKLTRPPLPIKPNDGPLLADVDIAKEYSGVALTMARMVTCLRRILIFCTVSIGLVSTVAVLVVNILWNGCTGGECMPDHTDEYRRVLLLLLIPQLFLPIYCIVLAAHANSNDHFVDKIVELESHGCFAHLDFEHATLLLQKLTSNSLPKISVCGITVNSRNTRLAMALILGSHTTSLWLFKSK